MTHTARLHNASTRHNAVGSILHGWGRCTESLSLRSRHRRKLEVLDKVLCVQYTTTTTTTRYAQAY